MVESDAYHTTVSTVPCVHELCDPGCKRVGETAASASVATESSSPMAREASMSRRMAHAETDQRAVVVRDGLRESVRGGWY